MELQSQLAVAESTPIHFDSTWLGFGGVHGGLLVGTLAEAAAKEPDAIPMAVSAHMYAPVSPGRADIAVDVHHDGRSGSAQASIGGAVNAARPGAGGPTPEFVVYIRLLDSFGLSNQGQAAVLLDALPPGLFAMMTVPTPIPTIEMTAHFAPRRRHRQSLALPTTSDGLVHHGPLRR